MDELLGNEFAALMVAAMRKLTAYLVQGNVHVGLCPFVKLFRHNVFPYPANHTSKPTGAPRPLLTPYHFFPKSGTVRKVQRSCPSMD
jgi:hypothetical protein